MTTADELMNEIDDKVDRLTRDNNELRGALNDEIDERARLSKECDELRKALAEWISAYEGWSESKVMRETGPTRTRRVLKSRKALACSEQS